MRRSVDHILTSHVGSLPGRRRSKFLGCQPPQDSVRTALIVMPRPRLDPALRVRQRQEPVRVEAFVAQAAVIAPNQAFTWRRLYAEGALSAIGTGEELVPASEYRAL